MEFMVRKLSHINKPSMNMKKQGSYQELDKPETYEARDRTSDNWRQSRACRVSYSKTKM